MSKKKVTLEEAKEIIDSDKIFYNGTKKFNVLDNGKYNSGITIEIPQEWTIDTKRKPENPIKYKEANDLTDGMNIDFDGNASILLGRYRLSKNGRPVFELTEPTKASDTLIRVSWGGSFNRTRGQYSDYAKEIGATFFARRSSNGGGTGNDYWILPVDFVKDMESRDVSSILKRIEQEEKERVAEIDEYLANEDAEIKLSIENRDRILAQIRPIVQMIQTYEPNFEFKEQPEYFTYKSESWSTKTEKYSDNLVSTLSNLLEKKISEKIAKDTFTPIYQEMEHTLNNLGISISYGKYSISLDTPTHAFAFKSYNYSQNGYNSFIEDVTQYQNKIEQEKEQARQKAEELRRATELKIKKEQAKEMGYPETFEFRNRLGGATRISHAYVIENDGSVREPDYNDLSNPNHVHHFDWKNNADGRQGYKQILPGEVIVTYTKDYRAVPYIFNVAWADDEITEEQLDVICDLLSEKASFAKSFDDQEIPDLREWIRNTVREKSEECKKQLHTKNQEEGQSDSFAEAIVNLAEEKAKAEGKNEKANQLAKAYEEQLTLQAKQKTLLDE